MNDLKKLINDLIALKQVLCVVTVFVCQNPRPEDFYKRFYEDFKKRIFLKRDLTKGLYEMNLRGFL